MSPLLTPPSAPSTPPQRSQCPQCPPPGPPVPQHPPYLWGTPCPDPTPHGAAEAEQDWEPHGTRCPRCPPAPLGAQSTQCPGCPNPRAGDAQSWGARAREGAAGSQLGGQLWHPPRLVPPQGCSPIGLDFRFLPVPESPPCPHMMGGGRGLAGDVRPPPPPALATELPRESQDLAPMQIVHPEHPGPGAPSPLCCQQQGGGPSREGFPKNARSGSPQPGSPGGARPARVTPDAPQPPVSSPGSQHPRGQSGWRRGGCRCSPPPHRQSSVPLPLWGQSHQEPAWNSLKTPQRPETAPQQRNPPSSGHAPTGRALPGAGVMGAQQHPGGGGVPGDPWGWDPWGGHIWDVPAGGWL